MLANSVTVIVVAQGVNPTSIDEFGTNSHYVEDGGMIRGLTFGFRTYQDGAACFDQQMRHRSSQERGWCSRCSTVAQMNILYAQPWKNRIFHASQASPDGIGGLPMAISGIKIRVGSTKCQGMISGNLSLAIPVDRLMTCAGCATTSGIVRYPVALFHILYKPKSKAFYI